MEKVAKTIAKPKNICIKAQFESPQHLHQIIIETLKHLQQTMP
jgi:hypothetical protein